MVIVEFMDRTPIENMASCIANHPETVVFVGDKKMMAKQETTHLRFLNAIGNDATKLVYYPILRNNLKSIVSVLTNIVEEYTDCYFDLTGGDELTLVAVGIIYERYSERRLQLHRYNIRTGKIHDTDADGFTVEKNVPGITVEQNLILHGGAVISSAQKENGTAPWNLNGDFCSDIKEMWEICKRNCGLWNYEITALGIMEQCKMLSEDELSFSVNIPFAEDFLKQHKIKADWKGYYRLEQAGLLQNIQNDGVTFSFTYKDAQVKRCLMKAGTILELVTYLTALSLKDAQGSSVFQDAMTGVFIDWDGDIHPSGAVDTENEIDVILMHGLVPIFISCKNGAVEDDELYKLSTVSERFGGTYAKKVLVATTLGKGKNSRYYFLERAKDMGIIVLEGVHRMTQAEFARKLRALAFG